MGRRRLPTRRGAHGGADGALAGPRVTLLPGARGFALQAIVVVLLGHGLAAAAAVVRIAVLVLRHDGDGVWGHVELGEQTEIRMRADECCLFRGPISSRFGGGFGRWLEVDGMKSETFFMDLFLVGQVK